jgi:membrane protease YdiL (CAAX protease family)
MHRDTPKTLGWRADNLWLATQWALIFFGLFTVALIAIGLALRQPLEIPPNLRSLKPLWAYFAFCLLQQVILNSFLTNRLLLLLRKDWMAALLAGGIFAACHWPNPVLVPLTFAGGVAMAWLFARNRNIIPLAILQAIIGSIAWWSFPMAWHHRLRVGPAYYPWR